jgi:RNA-binding protein
MTVVPATNPKKKSLMPSGELRRRLRGLAHALGAVVQIGKEGVTQAVVRQVTGALFDHELIKVKIGSECPADRFEVAERLGDQPGVNVVQILGRVVVLYKRHPERPRYEGTPKEAQPAEASKAKPRKPTRAPSRGREPRPAPGPRATKRPGGPRRSGRPRARS